VTDKNLKTVFKHEQKRQQLCSLYDVRSHAPLTVNGPV